MFPLWRDLTVSSESHVGFHRTSKGMSRMGMSSSSGCMRELFRCEAIVDVLVEVLCDEVFCFQLADVI